MRLLPRRRRPASLILLFDLVALAVRLSLWYSRSASRPARPRARQQPQTAPAVATPPRPRRRPYALLLAGVAAAVIGLPVVRPALATPRRSGQPHVTAQRPEGEAAAPSPAPAAAEAGVERPCAAPDVPGIDGLIEALTDGCEYFSPVEDAEVFTLDVPAWQDPSTVDASAPPAPIATPDTPVSRSGLSWPARGRITSLFGPAHPLGIDIALDGGAPIMAAADGRVAAAGYDSAYGNFVLINHAGGFATLYGHFMAPSGLQVGDGVRRGQVIGFAGSTGHAIGPHLHFEVRRFGLILNPLTVLPSVPLAIDPIAYRAPETATPTPTATPTAATPVTPEATATPSPTDTPSPPAATATPWAAVTSTPTASATQAPTPTPVRTATPSPTPSPTPAPSPTPSPAPSPSPSPTRTPTPTPTLTIDRDAGRPAPLPNGDGLPAAFPPVP